MENQKVVWAKINTKSNYKNLNGELLRVAQICGSRVTCWNVNEMGMTHLIDFTLDEIVTFEGLNFWQDFE